MSALVDSIVPFQRHVTLRRALGVPLILRASRLPSVPVRAAGVWYLAASGSAVSCRTDVGLRHAHLLDSCNRCEHRDSLAAEIGSHLRWRPNRSLCCPHCLFRAKVARPESSQSWPTTGL